MIIHLGNRHNDEATMKVVLADKDKEIMDLKRRLKILNIQPVQTLELSLSLSV